MDTTPRPVALDPPTLELIDSLARKWGLSPEATVQRALAEAERSMHRVPQSSEAKVGILKGLQERLRLTPEKAASWQRDVLESRR